MKELQDTAAHADTARDVWLDLEERFTQGVDVRVYELRRAIASLRQDRSTVSVYYGCLKVLWGELQSFDEISVCTYGQCTCGLSKAVEKAREKEMVFDFLMGLDEVFNTVRSHILSIDPLPSLGRVYAIVAQKEKQRIVAHNLQPQFDAAAMVAWKPQVDGRITNPKGKGERPRWGHCGKLGHLRETCYDLISYPADWSVNRNRKPQGSAGRANAVVVSSAEPLLPTVREQSAAAVPSSFIGLTLAQQHQLAQFVEQLNGGNFG